MKCQRSNLGLCIKKNPIHCAIAQALSLFLVYLVEKVKLFPMKFGRPCSTRNKSRVAICKTSTLTPVQT